MNRAATHARPRVSEKAGRFTESVIREMTRLAMQHGAINLAQGFPDFPAPAEIKEAAREAIAADVNQYAITWGARDLRQTIAAQFTARHGVPVDPEREITVCCGSTEAMISSMLAARERPDFVAAVRALDRLLISGSYVVPLFYLPEQWVARRAYIRHPVRTSLFGFLPETWWHEPRQALQ